MNGAANQPTNKSPSLADEANTVCTRKGRWNNRWHSSQSLENWISFPFLFLKNDLNLLSMLIIFHYRMRNGLLQNQLYLQSACQFWKLTPVADVLPHNFANLMLCSLLFLTLRFISLHINGHFHFLIYELASNICTYTLWNRKWKEKHAFQVSSRRLERLSMRASHFNEYDFCAQGGRSPYFNLVDFITHGILRHVPDIINSKLQVRLLITLIGPLLANKVWHRWHINVWRGVVPSQ